eukprot:753784-Hanusia_phi.AAC.5
MASMREHLYQPPLQVNTKMLEKVLITSCRQRHRNENPVHRLQGGLACSSWLSCLASLPTFSSRINQLQVVSLNRGGAAERDGIIQVSARGADDTSHVQTGRRHPSGSRRQEHEGDKTCPCPTCSFLLIDLSHPAL